MKRYYWQFTKELHSIRERLKFLEHDHPDIYEQFKLNDLAKSIEETKDNIEKYIRDEYEQTVKPWNDPHSFNDDYP